MIIAFSNLIAFGTNDECKERRTSRGTIASGHKRFDKLTFGNMLALVLLVLFALVHLAIGDCPDADIRCRIPLSNTGTMVWTNGCSGSVTAGVTSSDPEVTISGQCFNTETDQDSTTYADVGVTSVGQCYNAFTGGCQPENCPGNDPGLRCNQRVTLCTLGCVDSDPANCPTYVSNNECTGYAINNVPVGQICPHSCGTCAQYYGLCEGEKLDG